MEIKPFFARFLDTQKTVAAPALSASNAPATMQTMKYPSDSDSLNPNGGGPALKLPSQGLLAKIAEAFRPKARNIAEGIAEGLKEANTKGSGAPGNVVTMAYPSDSDVIGGRKGIHGAGNIDLQGLAEKLRHVKPSGSGSPGNVVTMAYPSDSDVIGGRKAIQGAGSADLPRLPEVIKNGTAVTMAYPSDSDVIGGRKTTKIF